MSMSVLISIRRSIDTYTNVEVSINTGIFINNSISISTNTQYEN